ncbi:MAG: hypothetical protein AMXMBFR13_48270 [Phycisphaerae bacterium]
MNDWLDAEARVERAQQFADSQQWTRALLVLDAAIAINPNDSVWHAHRGELLDQLGRYEEAIEAYQQALELGCTALELRSLLGIDLVRVERYQEAVDLFEELASDHPDYEPAYCHRIAAYTRMGLHEQAEEMFYLAQQLDADCPNCFHHLAESLLCRDEYEQAVRCWKRVLEIDPDYPQARQRIAWAHRSHGAHAEARDFYLAAIRQEPGDTELLADLGDLYVEMGNLARAAAKFEQVLELDPESARAHVMLGLIAAQQDRAEQAAEHLEAALRLDEAYPQLRAHLGATQLRRGNLHTAYAHLSVALEDDPEDAVALMAMGNCLLELQRPGEAVPYFEQLLELQPRLAAALHNVAICHFLQCEFEPGIEYCQRALEIEPDNLLILHKLGLVYAHLAQWRQARIMIARGLAVDPGHEGLCQLRRQLWRERLRSGFWRLLGRTRGTFGGR